MISRGQIAAVAVAMSVASCDADPQRPPAPASETTIAAAARAQDCEKLNATIVESQTKLLEKGDMAYGAESYETLARLREEIATRAGNLKLGDAKSQTLAAEYKKLNTDAADAERRAAAALRNDDAAAIKQVVGELTAISERERKVLGDLGSHCPTVVLR